jgi:hypothetical protein
MPRKNKIVFGALILSHGRADILNTMGKGTFHELKKSGYTGPVKIVVDNEDATVDRYRELFGAENVIVFDKAGISETFDEGDNFGDRRAIVYARNACFKIAKDLGWTHFIQLDDDYWDFRYVFASSGSYHHIHIRSLDAIWLAMVRFLEATPTRTIAMLQAGDLIGGQNSGNIESVNLGRKGKRKAMNTFVCSVDRPIGFVGRINEDVNTYVRKGSVGELFFTINAVRMTQDQTQTNSGGMTDVYKASGTYVKSFYSVMYMPSAVRVQPLTTKFPRLHHRISWRNCVPKILRESLRKPRT